MVPVMSRPPERASLHRSSTNHGENKLNETRGLKSFVRKVMDPAVSTFGLEPMSSTVSGPNVAATLAQYLTPHGTRAFIITDAGVNAAGVVTPITNALTTAGMKWQVFDQVSPNPTDINVVAGVAALNKFGLEGTVIVLIGGGSVME